MKGKKLVSLLLAAALSLTFLAGCSNTPAGSSAVSKQEASKETSSKEESSEESAAAPGSSTQSSGENVVLKFVFPGDVQKDQQEVFGKLNEKSFEEIGVGYDIEYIPWSDYDQKRNLYLQTGEAFDGTLVFVTELAFQWSKKAFAPLNDYISEEKTPNLLKVVDKQVFEDMSINGEYTCIPSIVTYQNWYNSFIIRGDLREKYGLPEITTLEGLEEYFAKIKENEPGMIPAFTGGWIHYERLDDIGYLGFAGQAMDLGGPLAVDPENPDKILNWIESDHFKKIAAINRRWYTNGWLDPDVLIKTRDSNQFEAGKFGSHTHDITVADTTTSPAIEGFRAERVILNPDAPGLRDMWGNNLVCVPHSSKNKEAVVKWVDWLYSDPANYELLLYGIEGKHYAKDGDTATLPEGLAAEDSGYPIWHQWYWAQGKLDLHKPLFSQDTKDLIKAYNDIDTPVVVSPTLGFTMDYAPVTNESTAVNQAWEKYGRPVALGVKDYAESYDEMVKAYKDAGVDALIAEAQKQYDAWRATRE